MSIAAKSVTVTAQVGNVSIPVNTITFRHTINALPMVEFTTQLANHETGNKTGIDLAEFQKLSVLAQEKFYNRISFIPDTNIFVTDGDGNKLVFTGYLMNPQLRIISGQISLSFSAIHVGAAFQAFNGSVYNSISYYSASSLGQEYFGSTDPEPLGPPGLLSQLENMPSINDSDDDWTTFFDETDQDDMLFNPNSPWPRTNSIAQRIYAIIQGLHTRALKVTSDQDAEIKDILNISVLNANSAVLPYIKHFLMGSLRTSIIEGLTDFSTDFENSVPADSPLLQTIFNILTESPNFLASVLNYINPFMFQLNATWDGKLAFEPNQFVQPPGNRLIKAALSDVTFALASNHELPLAQVIVLYPPEEFYAYGGNMGTDQIPTALLGLSLQGNPGTDVQPQNLKPGAIFNIADGFENISFAGDTLRYSAKYPEKPIVTAGQYLMVMAPAWTYPTSYVGKDLFAAKTQGENRFDAAVVQAAQNVENLTGLHTGRIPILDYLARTTYESCVLAKTSSFVSIPLCLKVQVGRTYTLASMDGAPLYQGYLNGVVHTIVIADTGAQAQTSLNFSHIIAVGAKLDGINKDPTLVDGNVQVSVANLA